MAVIALGIGFGGALALAGVAIQIVGHALEIQPRVCAPSRR